jgi:dihydropteroate synthase
VVTCSKKEVDGLLIGTKKHMEILSKKEMAQPFRLKNLADNLREFIKNYKDFEPKVMGVINANEDSFYPGSRFLGAKAIGAIEKMIEDGADIIDIGAMSTRPGSFEISEEEEFERVVEIIDLIYSQKLYEKVEFSIDSYRQKVVEYALDRGFRIVNDITALSSDEVAKAVFKYGAKVVLMHKKGTPKDMQINPSYEDVVFEVSEFFRKRILRAKSFGIKDIILDPGIGFGKRLEDNLVLIRDLEEFKRFGYEILVGASRKSMIDKIHSSSVEQRVGGTLAIHLKAVENGASIIRCHDVFEHKQAISVNKAIREIL